MKISSSGAIWKIAVVTVLAFAAEMALRRNRNHRKCMTKTTEEPSEIPARREEIALPTVVTSAETEVALIEEGQPVSHEVYREAEPNGELPPLTEPVFEPPVQPAVEQTLRPSVPQTPEIAPALAAVPMPPEAARLSEPSDEDIRLRAYFISEQRRRFALPGDADSDWREAKQQLLPKSGQLSGRSTITREEPSEIPARTEQSALPAVVTSAETEVALTEEGQPVPHEAYREAEPNGELPPLTEPVFESPVRPTVEQALRPSVPQTPEIAPALAAVPMPAEAARLTEPPDEEIRLRAYFISEHRRRFALPGDADSDWREAKQQLLSKSGELSGRSTITTEEPSEIPARREESALPAVVTSAETEVALTEEGQPPSHEVYREAERNGELPPLSESVFESPVRPAVEQTLRPSVPQTPEITPALAAVPMPAEAARPETTQLPTAPVNKSPATAAAKPQPSGRMGASVQLTFSFEIAAMQLTPTFKVGVLQVQPISKIVTMRLAPSQQAQLEGSFEIAKIQPVGETLGTIRVTPSDQQRKIVDWPSFTAAGLQLVSNAEATPVQVVPAQHAQAAVFVTIPCQITAIEFSPFLEIASVVLNSSSKRVLVHLAGAGLSPADGPLAFEIADLQLSEGGDAGMIQLNLLGQSPRGDETRFAGPTKRNSPGVASALHQHPSPRLAQVGSNRPSVQV
jgi:hypothetical protein